MFGLADHSPRARPGIPRLINQVFKDPHRLTAGATLGLGQFAAERRLQPRVTRESENVVDSVLLAPLHHLLQRAGGTIPVGDAELGAEQKVATENGQRQIAVATLVTVNKPPFLMAVERIVGRVEIEPRVPRVHPRGREE